MHTNSRLWDSEAMMLTKALTEALHTCHTEGNVPMKLSVFGNYYE